MSELLLLNPGQNPFEAAKIAPFCDDETLTRVLLGSMSAIQIDQGGFLLISYGMTRDTKVKAVWLAGLAGSFPHRPKQNLRVMEDVLEKCTKLARALEAVELRIEANSRIGWKSRLLTHFGFTEGRSYHSRYLRKAL